MSDETQHEEDAPRGRRARVSEQVARTEPEAGGVAVAQAPSTHGKPLTKEQRMAKARMKLASQHAQGMRGTVNPALAKENALRKQAGLPPIQPPVYATSALRMPDPTVILDGDGKPVGNPDMPITCVPRGDKGGGDIDTRINQAQSIRMAPIRYRADDPEGRFKAGDLVESPFGLHMQHSNDEDEAAAWALFHPTKGVDAQADALAQLQSLNSPGYRTVETDPQNHSAEQFQRSEPHYVSA